MLITSETKNNMKKFYFLQNKYDIMCKFNECRKRSLFLFHWVITILISFEFFPVFFCLLFFSKCSLSVGPEYCYSVIISLELFFIPIDDTKKKLVNEKNKKRIHHISGFPNEFEFVSTIAIE